MWDIDDPKKKKKKYMVLLDDHNSGHKIVKKGDRVNSKIPNRSMYFIEIISYYIFHVRIEKKRRISFKMVLIENQEILEEYLL